MCDLLDYQEDFTAFVHRLGYCLLIVYLLTRAIVPDYTVINWVYWLLMVASAVGFSFLNNLPLLQFSIQNTTALTRPRLIVCGSVLGLLVVLLGRQVYTKRIRWQLFVAPLCVMSLCYALFRSATSEINWHLHHAIASGLLSLCFTDFRVTTNRGMHAIMMGVVIQGINFYGLDELWLFRIDHTPPPSVAFLGAWSVGWLAGWNVVRYRNTIYTALRKKREKKDMPDLRMHLLDS